ncbi:MAG: ATP-binding cassette domain-containing protein, partial [Thermoplasmata archaeon]|nr:ATP-binding cassette domain-containing protein [Thermoplasmata archaeon]
MVDEENPMIIVENLKKSYDSNKKPVLDRINLSVEKGEMIILLGRSGCGKTTLLNMIAGLDRPTSGKIIINGTRIDELSEDQ